MAARAGSTARRGGTCQADRAIGARLRLTRRPNGCRWPTVGGTHHRLEGFMATLNRERSTLWEVNSRTIVYAAIGAALYGILLVAQIPIPGTTVSVRPAFAIVPFFGYAFGPVVGFFTGLVGNAIGDQISGWGALTSWNWS